MNFSVALTSHFRDWCCHAGHAALSPRFHFHWCRRFSLPRRCHDAVAPDGAACRLIFILRAVLLIDDDLFMPIIYFSFTFSSFTSAKEIDTMVFDVAWRPGPNARWRPADTPATPSFRRLPSRLQSRIAKNSQNIFMEYYHYLLRGNPE